MNDYLIGPEAECWMNAARDEFKRRWRESIDTQPGQCVPLHVRYMPQRTLSEMLEIIGRAEPEWAPLEMKTLTAKLGLWHDANYIYHLRVEHTLNLWAEVEVHSLAMFDLLDAAITEVFQKAGLLS